MSERTEDPTPRRLAKAREDGDVPTSGAATQAAALVVALVALPAAATRTAASTAAHLVAAIRGAAPGEIALETAREVTSLALPIVAAAAAGASIVAGVQSGGVFAPARARPRLERLDPASGLAGLVSKTRLFAVARALVGATLVAALAIRALVALAPDLASTSGLPSSAAAIGAHGAARLLRETAFVLVALALADVLVTRFAYFAKLKMTRAEVERERREADGDPALKAARDRAHREMLAAATVEAVRDATVVIVNPEHLATALRYRDDEDDAPVVVAGGQGELARRIIDAARAYGVPVVRDVPVARALRELEVGDSIPEALYEAVAEILRDAWDELERESGREPAP